jgi:hypothetical protein
MSALPADVAKFVAENPGLIEAAVDLLRGMLAKSSKDVVTANVRLRRRVDAELIRRAAVVEAARKQRGVAPKVERGVHTPEVAGASPAPATTSAPATIPRRGRPAKPPPMPEPSPVPFD